MGVSSDGITSRAGRAASYKHFLTAGVVKIKKIKAFIRAPRFELGISCV